MNLKIFLPVEDYTLTTKLGVEEINKRLSQKIKPKRKLKDFFLGDNSNKPYEGYLVSNTFEINRIIGYKNSFLPIVNGLIYSIEGKTYIKVEMKIIDYILIPVMIVIAVGLLISMFNLYAGYFNRLIPFFITMFAYLVIYFSFKIESSITGSFLKKLLVAEKNKI